MIEVAAGLVFHQGRMLIAQRRFKDHLGGLWEFPGGKRERGESFEACLARELREELAIEVEVLELVDSLLHAYPEKTIDLRFYRCRYRSGQPRALGCQAWAWITPVDLANYTFPPADVKVLDLLRSRTEFWKR